MTTNGESQRTIAANEPRSLAERSGEHRLILSILQDAIALHARKLSGRLVKAREAREAREWLESTDRSSPFGFEYICDQLGLDSSYIRRGLLIVSARPAEASARLAIRNRGRPPRPTRSFRRVAAHLADRTLGREGHADHTTGKLKEATANVVDQA